MAGGKHAIHTIAYAYYIRRRRNIYKQCTFVRTSKNVCTHIHTDTYACYQPTHTHHTYIHKHRPHIHITHTHIPHLYHTQSQHSCGAISSALRRLSPSSSVVIFTSSSSVVVGHRRLRSSSLSKPVEVKQGIPIPIPPRYIKIPESRP